MKLNRWLRRIIDLSPIWIFLILGLWLVVLKPLGPNLALVPGDLGDARFNNYVLEHFFRWVTGRTADYWNAPFYFPFQQVLAFSDNLLGSAPLYAVLRLSGIDSTLAFQGWYILGYLLNFAAAGYVLWRLKFINLAVGIGAFFFTFGLPLLAQENHAQLLYRFCIPLACYSLWKFYEAPRLGWLVSITAWLVWQFYLSIYLGIFLLLLLVVLVILLPFFALAQDFMQRLAIWPKCLSESWSQASHTGRVLAIAAQIILGLTFLGLILPYYRVSEDYSFSRPWEVILDMLPRLWSYLLADNSLLYRSFSSLFRSPPLRHEHQLFPGLAIVILLLAGIVGRFQTENRRLAWLHFGAAVVLSVLTLQIHEFTIYRFIVWLPGMDSVRAVTRIMLAIMWPLSLFAAWVVDGLSMQVSQRRRWISVFVYLVGGLLVAESVFYNHVTYNKESALARLDDLRQRIPATVPADPLLFVSGNEHDKNWVTEIDAMLLAQELGWPTLNGYSGNFPPGYKAVKNCSQLPTRIINYMKFVKISNPAFYLGIMKRVVPIGFTDCDPAWWEKMP